VQGPSHNDTNHFGDTEALLLTREPITMSKSIGQLEKRTTRLVVACCWLLLPIAGDRALGGERNRAPNVILIMTDDQGYGDLGVHGNPIIKTPNLDQFARQSVEVNSFYVCPVCAPTRATLMTGRYNYRRGDSHG
jgi:sulfatase-like protein